MLCQRAAAAAYCEDISMDISCDSAILTLNVQLLVTCDTLADEQCSAATTVKVFLFF